MIMQKFARMAFPQMAKLAAKRAMNFTDVLRFSNARFSLYISVYGSVTILEVDWVYAPRRRNVPSPLLVRWIYALEVSDLINIFRKTFTQKSVEIAKVIMSRPLSCAESMFAKKVPRKKSQVLAIVREPTYISTYEIVFTVSYLLVIEIPGRRGSLPRYWTDLWRIKVLYASGATGQSYSFFDQVVIKLFLITCLSIWNITFCLTCGYARPSYPNYFQQRFMWSDRCEGLWPDSFCCF